MSSVVKNAKSTVTHPCALIALIVMLVFDLIMLIVGVVEKDECPIDSNVTLYLIVAGGVGVVSKLIHICNKKLEWCLIDLICLVIYVAEFVWIILGSYWVYKLYKPNFDPNAGPYCNKNAYLLSFWFITVHWILVAISIFLTCCCCCCPNCVKWFDWRKS